jgi:hypothetical protein
MSHPTDVGVSRHVDDLPSAYILQPDLQGSAPRCTEKPIEPSSSVRALTECTPASDEDAVLRTIKFNDVAQTCTLGAERMIERREPNNEHFART